jgi:type IV secretory pathway VirB2 component (pilin)
MIRKLSTVIFAIITALAAWLAWPALSLAQGPEIVPCVAPQYDQPSSSVTLASEDVIPANGWSCNNCTFDVDSAVFGSPITGGSSYFTRTLALPAYHGAVQISITANTNSGRTGNVLARLGDAQEGFFATYDSTTRTFTKTLAQGTSHANALTLYGQSNGSLRLLDISISPVSDLSRNSLSFIDPDLNGIDYGSWYEVVTTTGVFSTGSRAVGGVLTIDHQDYDYRCTSLLLTANYSDSLIVNFDGGATGNSAVVVAGTVVPDLDDLDDALYGPSVSILNPGPLPYTMTAGISFTATGVTPAYLCIKPINHTGSTGDPYMDNFSASVCVEPVCTTLDDSDFDDTGFWTLSSGAAITDGVLYLDNPNHYAAQPVSIPFKTYTVTVSARSENISDTTLIVGFTDETVSELSYIRAVSITTPNTDPFDIYTATITNATTLGVNPHFVLMSLFWEPGVEVDWVCITGFSTGQCANPTPTVYDYGDDGQGDLRYWVPVLDPDPAASGFSDASWRPAPWWTLPPVQNNGGWWQGKGLDLAELAALALNIRLGQLQEAYQMLEDAFVHGVYNNIMYLKLPTGERQSLSSITVNVASMRVQKLGVGVLMLNDEGQWVEAGKEIVTIPAEYSDGRVLQQDVVIELDYPDSATEYIVTVGHAAFPNILINTEFVMVTKITTEGCSFGAAFTGECVVVDPDFDQGPDGLPDDFYWRWSNSAVPAPGFITLSAENQDFVSQHVFAPSAGEYTAQVVIDSKSPGLCGLDLVGNQVGSGDVLFSSTIQCTPGISNTYTTTVNLPIEPFVFSLEPTAGIMDIHYVCLSIEGFLICLNQNPRFLDGTNGYATAGLAGDQGILLSPGQLVRAIGVDYSATNGPWQLDVTATPVVSVVDLYITDGPNPIAGVDVVRPITATQTITYIIDQNEHETMVTAGDGPSVFDWDSQHTVWIQYYCITILDSSLWFGGKACDTLANPDFLDGLNDWGNENVTHLGGWVVFGGMGTGTISQSVTLPVTQTITGTLHWIGTATNPVSATAVVASDSGVFTVSRSFSYGPDDREFFDQVEVSGNVTVTIWGNPGLELDYVCLLQAEYTGSGDPGTPGDIGDVSANCAMPPMLIMSDTWDSWLPSIWIWESPAPTNYEIVASYATAWVRYIGCYLTGLGEMLEAKLNEIINLLRALVFLQGLDTLASLIQALIDVIEILEETVDDLIDTITGPVASLLYILGVIAALLLALAGLVLLVAAVIFLVWIIPQDFWSSFTDTLGSADAIIMPMPTDESHPLYAMLYGMQVINQSVGETVIFPIVIIAISASSFQIMLWTINRIRGLE